MNLFEIFAAAQLAQSADSGQNLSDYVKKTDYATSIEGGIVKIDGGLGIMIGSNKKLYCSRPSEAEILTETHNYKPLTPNCIPVFMSNYGINKDTIANKQDIIQVLSATEFENLDINAYPVGTIFMIWGDSE